MLEAIGFYGLVQVVKRQTSKNVVKCNEMNRENEQMEEGVFHD
jgi:hypothetical protein